MRPHTMLQRPAFTAIFVTVAAINGSATAEIQSQNYHDNTLLMGGVSEDERESLLHEAGRYNLWLAFIERDTGNYLSGVKVSVVDRNGDAMIDTVADGPWLLAHLPPGDYLVRISDGQEQSVTVNGGAAAMQVFRLDRQP